MNILNCLFKIQRSVITIYTVEQLDLSNAVERRSLEAFLAQKLLQLDEVEETYVIRNNDEIIATASRYGSILKCFAVAEKYSGFGLIQKLMTKMLEVCFEKKFRDLFIITKVSNKQLFFQFNFWEIYSSSKITLLHYGEKTIEEVIDNIEHLVYRKDENKATANGAIVMNANPFTLGHKYLIEEAARKVDKLIVFVLEEDRSYFSFKDRISLVKKNCALSNVIIVPSSVFMISSATFPTYFLKDKEIIDKEQAKMDVEIFARYFAKPLNIAVRFVGNEPLDKTTNMYNDVMHNTLPKFGIKLWVIERKKVGHEIISASKVRKYLQENEWDKLEKIVPRSTYEFLKRRC